MDGFGDSFLSDPRLRGTMKAIVRLLPGPGDLSQSMGAQMAQALSAFGASPGGRIPVDVPVEDTAREFVVEGAVRSESDASVVRFFDDAGRERALVPLHRIDVVRFD